MKIKKLITFESPITNTSSLYTLIIGLVCFLISAITPSFMSPDEVDHIKRAHWLSKGIFVLDAPAGGSSGEMLDNGLLQYINSFYLPFMKDRYHKLSVDEVQSAASITWSNTDTFSSAPGTGYYFPAIYAPQALGLWSGKRLGLTVDQSYHLARLMALIIAIFILIAAFEIHAPPPLAVAVIMLPMTLFQLASASLDGTANALAILAVSTFIKSCLTPASPQRATAILLGAVLFTLVSCRINLLPMLALPFIAYLLTKAKSHLIAGIITTLSVAIWLMIAITQTVDTRVITGAPTSSIAFYYAIHPIIFLKLVYHTLSTSGVLEYLKITFLGVLGWLDAVFAPITYKILGLLLVLSALLTFSVTAIRQNKVIGMTLLFCSGCSALMIYYALLITWNVHPASIIEGVQGRYFFIPAVILSYAISPIQKKRSKLYNSITIATLGSLLMYSSYATVKLLIFKYYIR